MLDLLAAWSGHGPVPAAEVAMPSDFMREALAEMDARIRDLSERIGELEALRQERDALARARDALAGELAAIDAAAPARPHATSSGHRPAPARPSRKPTAAPRPAPARPSRKATAAPRPAPARPSRKATAGDRPAPARRSETPSLGGPARRPRKPGGGDPAQSPAAAGPQRAGRRRQAALAPEAERVAGDVLALLAEDPGLTVDQLAARTGQAPGALHRLLLVLVDRGRVVRDGGHFSAA